MSEKGEVFGELKVVLPALWHHLYHTEKVHLGAAENITSHHYITLFRKDKSFM